MVEHINKVAGTGGENGTRRCLRAMERGGISLLAIDPKSFARSPRMAGR